MNAIRTLIALVVSTVVLIGCSGHADPVRIDGLKLYEDKAKGFAIKVPQNWKNQHVTGELVQSLSANEVARRMIDFGLGEGGARIMLRVVYPDTQTIADLMKNVKLEFEDGVDRYTKPVDVTLGGKPGKMIEVEFDQEDGKYKQQLYFVENDSLVTMVELAAFGSTFEDYSDTFKEILASVKLAHRPEEKKPDTLAPTGPEPPSETLRTIASPYFAIDVPDNFQGQRAQSSGMYGMSFVGSRLDCTIQVDVFDASKQNSLDKILEQNKGKYGGANANSTSLGGTKAAYFNYSGAAGIQSRAYFAVKGDKMYRITTNIYKAEAGVYQPIFDKCLATFKIK
jgi:hypothetical protein